MHFKAHTLAMELFLAISEGRFAKAMVILKELEEVLETYQRSC